MDPFHEGVDMHLGRTDTNICPIRGSYIIYLCRVLAMALYFVYLPGWTDVQYILMHFQQNFIVLITYVNAFTGHF